MYFKVCYTLWILLTLAEHIYNGINTFMNVPKIYFSIGTLWLLHFSRFTNEQRLEISNNVAF